MADAPSFSEKRYDDPEFEVPKVIIVWGQNPAATDPDGFFGHWIVDCMKRGSQDHFRGPASHLDSPEASTICSSGPAPSGALALGMLNVIINEGIYDKAFVDKWTLLVLTKLKERVQQYPPGRCPRITGCRRN